MSSCCGVSNDPWRPWGRDRKFGCKPKSPRQEASLLNLPVEVFHHICSFLDCSCIFDLKKVCRAFDRSLSDEYFWRSKAKIDYPETKLIVEYDSNIQFSRMYYEVERDKTFLKDIGSDEIETVRFKDVHHLCVQHIRFIDNDICVSVSYNGSIALWNVAHTGRNCFTHHFLAYDDEIMCVDVFDDKKFCTGSGCYNTLKLWSPELRPISTHRCPSTPMSVSCKNFLIVAGMGQNELLLHDIRENSSKTVTAKFSKEPRVAYFIIKVTLDDHCVYVTHEDGTISCFDLRTERILKSVDTLALVRPLPINLISCEYYKGNLVVGYLHRDGEVDNSTIVILNKNLEELTRNTMSKAMTELCESDDRFMSIQIQEYDVFVGLSGTLNCLLKSDPIVPLVTIAVEKGGHDNLMSMEYCSDRALLLGFREGDVVIHKRVNNTVNI